MDEVNNSAKLLRFGTFEADLPSGELRKNGRKVRIQDLPFRVLAALLERPGEVVTREELRQRLWAADTFVEFEHSLNAAVAKLRTALGDSADTPRFIETIPRRGYRFLGDVEPIGAVSPPSGPDKKPRWRRVAAVGVVLLTATLVWFLTRRPAQVPYTALVPVPLTAYPGSEREPSFNPDGSAVAFVWDGEEGKNTDIYVKTIGAEKPLRITEHPAEDVSPAWSPDGRHIAFVRRFPEERRVEYLLVNPTASDPERKVRDGPHLYWQPKPWLAWSPDSKWLALIDRGSPEEEYALHLVSVETPERRRLPSPPKRGMIGGPAFSPDGRTLVFFHRASTGVNDVYSLALSARSEAKGDPVVLHSGQRQCDGPVFTADGRSIVFAVRLPAPGLWKMRLSEPDNPQRLHFAGEGSSFTISAPSSRIVFAERKTEINIWRLKLNSARTVTRNTRLISSTRGDVAPAYSPDGKRIAFISDRSGTEEVWTCDSNGKHLMKLTSMGASRVGWPQWSPDGKRISFDSTKEGQWEVYLVGSAGGPTRRLTEHSLIDAVASWSHDGRCIYFTSHRSGTSEVWKMPGEAGDAVQLRGRVGRFRSNQRMGSLSSTSKEHSGRRRAPREPSGSCLPEVVRKRWFSKASKITGTLSEVTGSTSWLIRKPTRNRRFGSLISRAAPRGSWSNWRNPSGPACPGHRMDATCSTPRSRSQVAT